MSREPAVVLEGVRKAFGGHVAVDDVSLTIPRGSLYGFIGPNGSGKTTTLRMIMNILLPDRGVIEVLGVRSTKAARDRVSYLPEERGLYKKMRVRAQLRYYARLKGVPASRLERAIDTWLARMDLGAWADKRVEALSKGMSQKVQFIAAVLSEPELVILDEPFSGLDPVNAEVLKEAVLELKGRGTTVVFSTHDMAMAERLCDRIFMIFRGKKVLDGTLDEIQATHGQGSVRVRTDGGREALRDLPGLEAIHDEGNLQEVRLTKAADPQEFLRALAARTAVRYFELARPSLHDIFVRIARPEQGGRRRRVMRKVGTIAASEFDRAVRTKAFVISVLLMPVLMFGSIAVQKFADRQVDTEPRRFAVIDATGLLYRPLAEATAQRNQLLAGKAARFDPERADPGGRSLDELRLELSEKIRRGELFAFIEIPADALEIKSLLATQLRYYSDHPSYQDLVVWLELAVNDAVRVERYREAHLDPQLAARLDRRLPTEHLGLLTRGRAGEVRAAAKVDRLRSVGVPIILMFMLLMIVMLSAPQLVTAVLEEKMSRISEVLLGSVEPFDLMLGKLLGTAGIALVLSTLYVGGGLVVVAYVGKSDAVGPAILGTFFAFLILGMFLFGSIFIAIGAAVTDIKDAQSLMTPVLMVVMLPTFTWMAILKAPSSSFAVAMSLFPPAAPFLLLLRMALHPGPPLWQIVLGVSLAIGTTIFCVWAAARIFRVGLLLQGKSAGFGQMLRWVLRG